MVSQFIKIRFLYKPITITWSNQRYLNAVDHISKITKLTSKQLIITFLSKYGIYRTTSVKRARPAQVAAQG